MAERDRWGGYVETDEERKRRLGVQAFPFEMPMPRAQGAGEALPAAAPRSEMPMPDAGPRDEMTLPSAAAALTLGRGPALPDDREALAVAQGNAIAPFNLPPVTVEASRLPPVVEGVTMRRGAPGSGEYGERSDLTPQYVARTDPMTLEEAKAKGLIMPARAPRPFTFEQIGRAPTGENAGMGMTGDAQRRAMDDATRGERWGQRGSTTRAMGRAQQIVDQIRANRDAKVQSEIRVDEAVRTPQLSTGTYVGQSWQPDGKGGGTVGTVDATMGTKSGANKPMTPAQALTQLKQADELRTGNKLKGIAPNPAMADAFEAVLKDQGYDLDELKGKKAATKAEPAAEAGAKAGAKPAIKDGTIGVFEGRKYVYRNNQWNPA
jgi:hypothetical protein